MTVKFKIETQERVCLNLLHMHQNARIEPKWDLTNIPDSTNYPTHLIKIIANIHRWRDMTSSTYNVTLSSSLSPPIPAPNHNKPKQTKQTFFLEPPVSDTLWVQTNPEFARVGCTKYLNSGPWRQGDALSHISNHQVTGPLAIPFLQSQILHLFEGRFWYLVYYLYFYFFGISLNYLYLPLLSNSRVDSLILSFLRHYLHKTCHESLKFSIIENSVETYVFRLWIHRFYVSTLQKLC